MAKNKSVKFKVFRKNPKISNDYKYDEFDVPLEDGMVVLDGINYIIEHYDSTISVRWNCKAARCGSCAAEINGYPKLMCKTRIEEIGDSITVNPMKAFPLVKDLVTDVSINFEIDKKIPEFKPKVRGKTPWKIYDIDVNRAQEFRKCIECFLCQDTCHVVRDHNTKYIGPRHVIKAAALDMHPLDTIDRSEMLTNDMGLGYCNVTKCCQEVCPEHIKITDNAIIPEKERAADNIYDPIIMLIKRLRSNRDKK